MTEKFRDILKNNNLKIIKQLDDINIIIPEEIIVNNKVDEYVKMYKLALKIKEQFYDLMVVEDIKDINVHQFIENSTSFNSYEYNKIISKDLNFNCNKIKEKLVYIERVLNLDKEEVNKLKEEANKKAIESVTKDGITDNEIDIIINKVKNSKWIEKDELSNYGQGTHIVVGYIDKDKYEYNFVHDTFSKRKTPKDISIYDENKIGPYIQDNIEIIHIGEESLQYIKSKKIPYYVDYCKVIKLDRPLSLEDLNLIEASIIVALRPKINILSKIKYNRKWYTYSKIKEKYCIDEKKFTSQKCEEMFSKVDGCIKIYYNDERTYNLYNIELLELACKIDNETEKIRSIFNLSTETV